MGRLKKLADKILSNTYLDWSLYKKDGELTAEGGWVVKRRIFEHVVEELKRLDGIVFIYCPACGEHTEATFDFIGGVVSPHPTKANFKCCNCGTKWRLEFFSVEDTES